MSLETKMGVDPFDGRGMGRVSEAVSDVSVEKDEKVEQALEFYHNHFKEIFRGKVNSMWHFKKNVLKPNQIFLLFELLIADGHNSDDSGVGGFISKAIQESYFAGNNGFYLETGDTLVNDIGDSLKGYEDLPLELTVRGNVGTFFGASSRYCLLKVEGYTGDWCGMLAYKSEIWIGGNTAISCGIKSVDSSFYLGGWYGNEIGLASKGSVFKTADKNIFRKLSLNLKTTKSRAEYIGR